MGSRTPQLNQEDAISKSWEGGSTRASRTQRARILLRDGNTCQLKIPNVCTQAAEHAHHVLGKGISELDIDIVAACAACNLHVGQPNGDPPHRVTQW